MLEDYTNTRSKCTLFEEQMLVDDAEIFEVIIIIH